MVNGPQLGCRLKYFMRLVAIGFAYCRERFGVSDLGCKIRRWRLRLKICGAKARPYSASIVPRQFAAPQWQANFLFDSSVIGSSISIA